MWHVASPRSKYFSIISKNMHVNKKIVILFCAHCGSSKIRYGSLEEINVIASTTVVVPYSNAVASINITLVFLVGIES